MTAYGLVSAELDDLNLSELIRVLGSKMGRTMSVEEVLSGAREKLKTARFGLEDMRQRPERFYSGLMNAIVFGRMVTFALQNLRSKVDGYDEWYAEKQAELKADPLMRFFSDLRTEIEKRTERHTGVSSVLNFNLRRDRRHFEPAPPGAISMFIADQTGGSGWQVRMADGSIEHYYVDIPKSIADVQVYFLKAPIEYAGRSADDLLEQYLDKLSALVSEAQLRFR